MFGLTELAIVRYLGLYIFLWHIYIILYSIYDFIKTRFFPVDFKKLGEWVVITGSTDGIGKELAKSFAKKGMNIVLISRTESRLKDTAAEIEKESGVKVLCVQADFKDRACYENIEKNLKDLDIGVLVNNVGTAAGTLTPFMKFSTEDLWNELDVNTGSMITMTRMVLPQMKKKRKGMIINNSSLAAEIGMPYMGIYSATKSFMNMLSLNLHVELNKYNIQIRCLTPGFVTTKLLDEMKPFLSKLEEKNLSYLKIVAPNAEEYVNYAMKTLSSESIIFAGYWMHTFVGMKKRTSTPNGLYLLS